VQSIKVGKNIENYQKAKPQHGESKQIRSRDLSKIGHLLGFLNHKDRDILYLIFVTGSKQNCVRKILNRSQPSLHYDISRIKKRLEFIYYLDLSFDIFMDFIEQNSNEFDPNLIDIMICMYYTTSFTQAAHILGEGQLKIRHKFDKLLRLLEDKGYWDILEIFTAIRSRLNIVKRVYNK
jgi:hypothetical protein